MTEKYKTQVPKEHYYKDYDDVTRFISYFYQIDSVIKTNPKTILEVGIGNKTVSNYLKQFGFDITLCDFDVNLEPDVVADVGDLPFKDDKFDAVLACEILEHIPFEDVSMALSELKRISKKYVIISIPDSSFFTELLFNINIPFLNKKLLHYVLSIPFFTHKFKKTNEHYWEMGYKNYSKKQIRKLLKRYFEIKKEFQPILNPCHYFFILEKSV
ncbi:MAG: methyltransferase domain-containing protein [Methanophagales archaeon]|nr:methyltransferase domain-containing protein [Methanophagales archaeon]